MDKLLEIKGFLSDGLTKKCLYLRIDKPVQIQDTGDYYCRIHCPVFFKTHKDIFGIDEHQAYDLAVSFIKSILGGRKMIDRHSKEIKI